MGRKFQGAGRVYLLKLQEQRDQLQQEQELTKMERLEEKLLHGVERFMDGYAKIMMWVLIPGSILFMLFQ